METQYNTSDRQRAAVANIFAIIDAQDADLGDFYPDFTPVAGIIMLGDGEALDTRNGSPFRFDGVRGLNRCFSEDKFDNVETFAARVVFMRGTSKLGIERCWLPAADGEIRYVGSLPSESSITNL